MTRPLGDRPASSQQPIASVVRRVVSVFCLDRLGQEHDLEIELGFDARDPYAVTVAFPTEPTAVAWSFARSLLSRGVTDPTGYGDVLVWPSLDGEGSAVVGIRLSSPDGQLILEARASQVYSFLSATVALVPFGAESGHLDIDALVSQLLDR